MNERESAPLRVFVVKNNDHPWIGLLILAVLTFISSVISLVTLCCLWRRYRHRPAFYDEIHIFSHTPMNLRSIPIPIEDRRSTLYETQVEYISARRTSLFAFLSARKSRSSSVRATTTTMREASAMFTLGTHVMPRSNRLIRFHTGTFKENFIARHHLVFVF